MFKGLCLMFILLTIPQYNITVYIISLNVLPIIHLNVIYNIIAPHIYFSFLTKHIFM